MNPEAGSKHKESAEFQDIAAAIIEQDGKFLVAKRALHKDYGGKWEVPGGKFEPGESAEEALRREVREELGTEVEIVRALPAKDYRYSDGGLFRMHYFICKIGQGPLKLKEDEHSEHRWVTSSEFPKLDFLETDKSIFNALQENEKPGN